MKVMRQRAMLRSVLLLAVATLGTACSIRGMAANSLGNALAEGNSVFASEDDPELVREAVPFGLKTMEGLLEASPRHRGLLYATAAGFTQYAYAFVQQDADQIEAADLGSATAARERAKRLYLRARDYGFRGIEVDARGFRERLSKDPEAALRPLRPKHVRLLYWTAVAWASAMALQVDDSSLSADQYLAEAMMRRALALDEAFELGSIHDFFIAWEAGRRSVGGSLDSAEKHFARAMTLSRGRRVWPLVTRAETVCVARQDRQDFLRTLDEALAVDPGAERTQRLANLLAQRRARWLRSRADELFIE
jgi:predicted anti-sigma-YlaC factor YlaD